MHVHWGTEIKIVNCLYLLLSHSLFPTRFAYNCCQLFTQLIVFFAFVLISHGAFFPISDSFSVDFILTSILFFFHSLCLEVRPNNMCLCFTFPSLSPSICASLLIPSQSKLFAFVAEHFFLLWIYIFPLNESVECKLIDCITPMR